MEDFTYKDAFTRLVIIIFACTRESFTDDEIHEFVGTKNNKQLTDDCIRLLAELAHKAGVAK